MRIESLLEHAVTASGHILILECCCRDTDLYSAGVRHPLICLPYLSQYMNDASERAKQLTQYGVSLITIEGRLEHSWQVK